MFLVRLTLFLSLFASLNLSADSNTTIEQTDTNETLEQNSSYIDWTHDVVSKNVVDISKKIDTTLSDLLQSSENNGSLLQDQNISSENNNSFLKDKNISSDDNRSSSIDNNISSENNGSLLQDQNISSEKNNSFLKDKNKSSKITKDGQSIDAFYKNKKYIDETDETYVSVRLYSYFQSKEPSQYNAAVNAQVPLSHTQKKFHIFIENLNQESTNDLVQQEPQPPEYPPIIGVNYFTLIYRGIKSKHFIATQGLNPLARARYYGDFKAGRWNIEPAQTFTYSVQDKFEEESNIYFDNQTSDFTLFRIVLHRKTKEKMDGMDYGISFQYYWSLKKNTGLSLSQSFSGNTEYQYIEKNSVTDQKPQTYSGINNYATSISWRKNIFKEWFFYQITPGVNFHKQYDYQANYTLIFLFDLYFGNLKY